MPVRLAFLSQIWLSPLKVVLILVSSFLLPIATDRSVSAQDIPPELKTALLEPWIGDFQGMTERRTIRILTPYSRSFFFVDGAKQLGREVERGQALEQMLNRSRKKAVVFASDYVGEFADAERACPISISCEDDFPEFSPLSYLLV